MKHLENYNAFNSILHLNPNKNEYFYNMKRWSPTYQAIVKECLDESAKEKGYEYTAQNNELLIYVGSALIKRYNEQDLKKFNNASSIKKDVEKRVESFNSKINKKIAKSISKTDKNIDKSNKVIKEEMCSGECKAECDGNCSGGDVCKCEDGNCVCKENDVTDMLKRNFKTDKKIDVPVKDKEGKIVKKFSHFIGKGGKIETQD